MMKTVLITGAAKGIGRATSKTFVGAGWQVVGVDIQDLAEPDSNFIFLKGDLSDPASSKVVFDKAAELIGRLDALVNNAAVQICKPILEMDVREWDSIMAVNVRSIFLAVKNAFPFLRSPGASIINVSSVHAIATSVNIAAYAASKGAVLSLTRALALEMASNGIRVNAILPGAVDTNMLRDGLCRGHVQGNIDEKLESLGRRTPIARVGRPEEIAQAILFLAENERSSFMTGQALVVDGGATARLSTE